MLRIPLLVLVLLVPTAGMCGDRSPYNRGVEAWRHKDYSEAARQWAAAVQDGNPEALNNLGFLYSEGWGVPQELGRALRLWRLAASAGVSESQWHLGDFYEHGRGVHQSDVYALAWYLCAVATATRRMPGDGSGTEKNILADAQASLERVQGRLSGADLDTARALGHQLIDRYALAPPSPLDP